MKNQTTASKSNSQPVHKIRHGSISASIWCQARLPFALCVRNDNKAPRLIKLVAMCGALDIEDPQPAITILLPAED